MAFTDDLDDWGRDAAEAQKGDKRAYHRLLNAISPFIRSVVLKTLHNPEVADDIMQDVLISVHKSLHTYTPDRPFKPWLYAIINFRSTDYLRQHYSARKNKQVSEEVLDFEGSYVTEQIPMAEIKDIEAALDKLPKQQRDIFTKVKIEGYSIEEVAKQMGMNESAVKVSAHRTVKKLKGMLE